MGEKLISSPTEHFLFIYQTSDATLELTVLGGVDERIDTTVGEHQHHGEVVQPAGPEEKLLWGVSCKKKLPIHMDKTLTGEMENIRTQH